MRLLHELDIARLALMPSEQQRRELVKMKGGRPPYTYNPVRKLILDILNVAPGPLFPAPKPTSWEQIIACITRIGGPRGQVPANIGIASALHAYAVEHEIGGYREEFVPLTAGISQRLTYWSPVVLNAGKSLFVPYFDPRRTAGLTRDGRRFVFSVMHDRIRALNPDLAKIGLAIFQFDCLKNGTRLAVPHFADDEKLLGIAEIEAMIGQVYEIWLDVLAEREEEARRADGRGPLGI